MRPEIVLDKSYFQGAPVAAIRKVCETFRVIMPGALLFELLRGDADERARCFAKLPETLNPVEIVEHVGKLLRYEARSGKPASKLYERRQRFLFRFSPKLAVRTGEVFVFSAEQKKAINDWEKEVRKQLAAFRDRVSRVHHWFPEIASASNRDRPKVIKEIQGRIASDVKLVRKLYSQVRQRSFPHASRIDQRWAFFRWMQVNLVAALDHINRYGIGTDLATARDIENEVIDLQYRIMGTLAGGLATRDRKCKEAFQLLRPDGVLIC